MKFFACMAMLMLMLLASCGKDAPAAAPHQEYPRQKLSAAQTTRMAFVEGGSYTPFYRQDSATVFVKPFRMDVTPVTNAQYLEFVKKNPAWRKSEVKRLFADSTYLKDWPDDLMLPRNANRDAPVCYVSWFAAKAYAQAAGKRLPTLDEWEYVARADEKLKDATGQPEYSAKIIALYQVRGRQLKPVGRSAPNVYGIYDLFNLIWEWTDDFNSVLSSGDSRSNSSIDKNLVCATAAATSTDVNNYAAFMRFGMRTSLKANYTVANLGFRCAKDTIISKK